MTTIATETNWAGNYTYRAQAIRQPESVGRLQELIVRGTPVRALGSRHSFNAIADTAGELVSLAALPARADIDPDDRTVTVSAGMRYGDLAEMLQAQGWALHNLASLPHISIAGAIATGTHGSGNGNGNLATAVAAVTFVDGRGELVTLRRGDPEFAGAVVALGAVGIVTEVTLDIRPTFEIAQSVYLELPWERVLEQYDEISGSAYSVSLFTSWRGDAVEQVWRKAGAADATVPADFFGARPAGAPVHMLPTMSAVNCTEQLGVAGSWHERLPHFRLAFTPSNGEEIQSEYLVPRRHATAAMAALRPLGDLLAPVLQISEIRSMAADALWLSAAYDAELDARGVAAADAGTVGFHFTWVRDQAGVEAVLPAVEAALAPFGARPHWGKVYLDRDGVVPSLYPRLADFAALAERFDPRGIFRNAFLDRLLAQT